MPSFVVHGLVPPLLFLAMGFDRRKVLLLFPLTYLPDLDHVIGVPRASLHNLFILLPALAMLAWSYRDATYAPRREWAVLALGYLGSHLVMDAFNGGWSPLFPFADFRVLVTFVILLRYTPSGYELERIIFEYGARPGPPTLSPVYPWLSAFETAMLAFVLVALLVAGVARLVRRSRAA